MAKKSVKKAKLNANAGQDDIKVHAFLTAFLSIVGFLIALIAWKDEEYTMFYAKQSLIIFLAMIFAQLVTIAFNWTFLIGDIISFVLWAFVIILWVLSWIYALSGKTSEVPLIGAWANKLKI